MRISSFVPKSLLILCAVMAMSSCNLQEKSTPAEPQGLSWPEITSQSKPWTRWWWEGSAVRNEDLTAAMEAYQTAQLGGLEITPIYGVYGYEDRFLDFLSPKWMDAFMFTLREGDRLDLGIDLANASGWPFGGPWVDESYACKNMVYAVYQLNEGEQLTTPITYTQRGMVRSVSGSVNNISEIKNPLSSNEDMQTLALDQVRFEKQLPIVTVVAYDSLLQATILTDKVDEQGMLQWTAPAGKWTIYALFQGDHGKMVERAGPGGEGNVIDHFSVEATGKYLSHFDEAFKGYDLSSLRYYFNDSYEVDDAQGDSDWTPLFLQEFKTRRGYDLTSYLPALFGFDTPEKNARVRYDYRHTINDLILDGYTKTWQKWAAKQGKGIRNQAHGSPANILDLYAASDIPETEGREIIYSKTAASAAHVTGKTLVSSETATWLSEHFESNLSDVKTCVDGFLLAGVNHIFYHGTSFSPQDAPWPGWLFYAAVHFQPTHPFWTDFATLNEYIARCQSFLQAGNPDNDILLYYTISDAWSQPGRTLLQHFKGLDASFDRTSVKTLAETMINEGYAWDLISDLQIRNLMVKDGTLETGHTSYKTIILPECQYIPLETLERMLFYVKKGATLIVHRSLPGDVAGFKDYEAQQKKLQEMLSKINFTASENEKVQSAIYGKGRILLSEDIDALLQTADIRRESMYDKGLQCIRRRLDNNKTYYFIANRTSQAISDWIPLATNATSYALYEPMTAQSGLLPIRQEEGQTSVLLQLEAGASCIVEAYDGELQGEPYIYYKPASYPIVLSDSCTWELSFIKGGPTLPASQTLTSLDSWTTLEGEEYASFSGTASYSTALPQMGNDSVDFYQLDLGIVKESASVFLNGKHLQTLISDPYCLTIPKEMFTGTDTLTIEISNSMANRIAYLDRQGFSWKIFYNTNFPARRGENSNRGVFDASLWTPKPSGLLGPVIIAPVIPVENE